MGRLVALVALLAGCAALAPPKQPYAHLRALDRAFPAPGNLRPWAYLDAGGDAVLTVHNPWSTPAEVDVQCYRSDDLPGDVSTCVPAGGARYGLLHLRLVDALRPDDCVVVEARPVVACPHR